MEFEADYGKIEESPIEIKGQTHYSPLRKEEGV